MALTAKEKMFAECMIKNNHNAYRSYLEAYPDCNENSAKKGAYRVMKKDEVVEYINALEEEALHQAGITPARIANELAKQAFAEVDNDNGLTYQVKQNAIKLLQSQFGLDKKVVEARVYTTTINVNIEDDDE